MLDFSIYLFYRAGLALLTALPLRTLFVLGNGAGFCAWLILGKYRRLARRNVSIAFGNEKSPRELRGLVRRHFQRLGANLLCGIKLAVMPLEKMETRVETENFDVVHRQLRAGRPVVLILSHLGNWELFAQILPRLIGYVRDSTITKSCATDLSMNTCAACAAVPALKCSIAKTVSKTPSNSFAAAAQSAY